MFNVYSELNLFPQCWYSIGSSLTEWFYSYERNIDWLYNIGIFKPSSKTLIGLTIYYNIFSTIFDTFVLLRPWRSHFRFAFSLPIMYIIIIVAYLTENEIPQRVPGMKYHEYVALYFSFLSLFIFYEIYVHLSLEIVCRHVDHVSSKYVCLYIFPCDNIFEELSKHRRRTRKLPNNQ